jgi:hypothetical protein
MAPAECPRVRRQAMTTFATAGLLAVAALAGLRIIALLTAMAGFLITSRRADKTEQASLFTVLTAVVRDIAIASPSRPHGPTPRNHRIPRQRHASADRDPR